MGAAARAKADKYTWNAYGQKILRAVRAALEKVKVAA